MVQTLSPITQEADAGGFMGFASLVYIVPDQPGLYNQAQPERHSLSSLILTEQMELLFSAASLSQHFFFFGFSR